MTEKRFTIDFEGFLYDNGEIVEDIMELLNDLSEENEQLKSEIKDLNDVLARYEEKELKSE